MTTSVSKNADLTLTYMCLDPYTSQDTNTNPIHSHDLTVNVAPSTEAQAAEQLPESTCCNTNRLQSSFVGALVTTAAVFGYTAVTCFGHHEKNITGDQCVGGSIASAILVCGWMAFGCYKESTR